MTNPGRIPLTFGLEDGSGSEDEEGEDEEGVEEDKKNREDNAKDAKGRWCKKCEAVKPPRAHHCRQCGRYESLDLCR